MTYLKSELAAINEFKSLIDGSQKIAIVCHVSPDGDAIGSTLGLWHVLRGMGKHPVVITPDMPPRSLMFLPGVRDIVIASQDDARAEGALAGCDLLITLDFNAMMRVDKLEEKLRRVTSPIVMVDHHLNPEDFPTVRISHPEKSSTCLLLYQVLQDMGVDAMIDHQAATCLLAGMMTDTGGMAYNANDPELYAAVSHLVAKGANHDKLYKLLFDTGTLSRLRIFGYALSEKMTVFDEFSAALITLDSTELIRLGYNKGDTESLVNQPLSVPAITYSCFMREDTPGFVKVSMRSKGDFPVSKMCEEFFGGGGHLNAAGGEFYGPLDDAVKIFKDAMILFKERYQ